MKSAFGAGAALLVVALSAWADAARIPAVAAGHASECAHLPTPAAAPVTANDNRRGAGELRDGVLMAALVMTTGTWYPDGPEGCGIEVHAFAEEDGSPVIPGPLLRAQAGTELRVTVRNDLPDTVWIRGLEARPAEALEHVALAPGARHEFRFRAGDPGTYFYAAHGHRPPVPPWQPPNDFAPLAGAFVVDPVGTKADDRVFVLTRWVQNLNAPRQPGEPVFELNTINGLSWPHTERLTVTEGEAVRWRVVNPTDHLHPMHLHGFYFRVLSRGANVRDVIFAGDDRQLAVTEALGVGQTMSLEWVPDEVGNWIFHCHLVRHMSAGQRLERAPGALVHDHGDHPHGAEHDMAGLVMGLTVLPARGRAAAEPVPPRKRLRLFANQREGVFGDRPGFGFVLQEGTSEPAADSVRLPGSPLLLTRGEATEIVLHNRTARPLAVHWHGLELESYFDGVAGWSGVGDRIAPAAAPGDSFVVRITPRRAGTFFYHIHNEHADELVSGLYGAFLVSEPGESLDDERDRVFVLSEPGPGSELGAELPPFINGSGDPEPLELRTGVAYRLRFIGISADDLYVVRIEEPAELAVARGAEGNAQALAGLSPLCRPVREAAVLANWTSVARDGADLPPSQRRLQPACLLVGAGTAFDFAFMPDLTGELSLDVQVIDASSGRPRGVTTMRLLVRASSQR